MQEAAQICKISWTANAVRRNFNLGPCTVQLCTRVLTNFWNKLGPLVAKFCKAGCTSTIFIFKLLQTRTAFRRFRGRKNFSTVDPKSYWTIIIHILGGAGFTCQCPALDSLLDSFYSEAGWCHTCKDFLLFGYLQVPEYPNTYAYIKQKYQNGNIHRNQRVPTSTIFLHPEV